MNEKISVFVICVEAIIYVLLHNLYECAFNWSVCYSSFYAKYLASRPAYFSYVGLEGCQSQVEKKLWIRRQ